MSRPLCKSCGKHPAAVNYHKGKKIFYRKRCESCNKRTAQDKAKLKPRWLTAGYKKKNICEKCGFKAKHNSQMFVYFIDGDMQNIHITNLKSVCSNCQIDLALEPRGWSQGDLVVDL